MVSTSNLINFLMEEFDEVPCNINCYDEFMFDKGRAWCENHCDNQNYKECWKKLLQLKGVVK